MARITINANNVSGADSVQVRYRAYGSSNSYQEYTISASQLPYSIENIASGRYEVGVRKKCGGTWSDWSVSSSQACASAIQFSVSRSGSNFVAIVDLADGQGKYEIEVVDPNNGKIIKPYTGNAGTQTFAITPFVDGNFTFRLRGICDDTVIPVYASDWTDAVNVLVDTGCNAPVITSNTQLSSAATTVTQRLVYTNYSTNIRVRVVNNAVSGDFANAVKAATGTEDIVLLKNTTYTIFIYNQCANSQELAATVQVTTPT